MNGNKLYIVDGNIGTGKSTILKYLKTIHSNDKNIIFLQEPVDEWKTIIDENGNDIITNFYENQEKYSFSFQILAYISRLNLINEILANNKNSIIISERSLYTDKEVFAKMLYDTKKIEKINYSIYLKWFNSFLNNYIIEGIIYIKSDPIICYDRIMKRSRTGENSIDIKYLNSCDKYHNDMIENFQNQNYKILYINGNIEIDDKIEFNKSIMEINNFIINN